MSKKTTIYKYNPDKDTYFDDFRKVSDNATIMLTRSAFDAYTILNQFVNEFGYLALAIKALEEDTTLAMAVAYTYSLLSETGENFLAQISKIKGIDPLFIELTKDKIDKIHAKKGEVLEGGEADYVSVADLAKKHNVDVEVIELALQEGRIVEMEHTDNPVIAHEIAKDHIFEKLTYYDDLKKMEGKSELPNTEIQRLTELTKDLKPTESQKPKQQFQWGDHVKWGNEIVKVEGYKEDSDQYHIRTSTGRRIYAPASSLEAANNNQDQVVGNAFKEPIDANSIIINNEFYKNIKYVITDKSSKHDFTNEVMPYTINMISGGVDLLYSRHKTIEDAKEYLKYLYNKNQLNLDVKPPIVENFGAKYEGIAESTANMMIKKKEVDNDYIWEILPFIKTTGIRHETKYYLKGTLKPEIKNITYKEQYNETNEQQKNEPKSEIKRIYDLKTIPSTKEQVERALASSEVGKSLSKEQLEHLHNWEGFGGNYKADETKTGGLHEFFTPYWLCKAIAEIIESLGVKTDKVLDPATGTLRLLRYIEAKEIHAFEINEFNYKIAKKLYPNAKIYNQAFETAFLKAPRYNSMAKESWLGNDFDLVVSNPPYGEYKGEYKSYMPRLFTRFEFLFIELSMSLVRSGGHGIFVLPQSFMNNGNMYNKMKEKIMESCEFVDAVRFPNGIFANTDIGVDLLILKKM